MNKKEEIGQGVKSIVCDHLCDGVDIVDDDVVPKAAFVNDLGADSLKAIDIILEIEGRFSISIDEEEVGGIVTVADLIKCVLNKVQSSKIARTEARETVSCVAGFAVS